MDKVAGHDCLRTLLSLFKKREVRLDDIYLALRFDLLDASEE